MASKALVTGSHGFIGSRLVKALKERGDEVVESDSKTGTDLFQWNVIEAGPYDEIYHLACVNQELADFFPAENLKVNAMAAKLLSGLAAEQRARFVYTSTASVYGNAKQIPTPVDSHLQPKTDYAVAKLAGEHFVKSSGADYTIFRLSNVYGPGQSTDNPYCGVVAKFMEGIEAGETLKIFGDGAQTRDFTYVGDVVKVLMNPEHKGLLNVSHGDETSVLALAEKLGVLMGKKVHFQFTDERPVDGIRRRVLISDAECPTDLKTGLLQTLKWFYERQ